MTCHSRKLLKFEVTGKLTALWISVNKQFSVNIIIRMEDDIDQHFPGSFLRNQDGCRAYTISNHEDEQQCQKVHHVNKLRKQRRKIY